VLRDVLCIVCVLYIVHMYYTAKRPDPQIWKIVLQKYDFTKVRRRAHIMMLYTVYNSVSKFISSLRVDEHIIIIIIIYGITVEW